MDQFTIEDGRPARLETKLRIISYAEKYIQENPEDPDVKNLRPEQALGRILSRVFSGELNMNSQNRKVHL